MTLRCLAAVIHRRRSGSHCFPQRAPEMALPLRKGSRRWIKKALRRSLFLLILHQVICPTSCFREFLSIPSAKNKSLHTPPKSSLQLPPSHPA
jgi:hypothetical protein